MNHALEVFVRHKGRLSHKSRQADHLLYFQRIKCRWHGLYLADL